MGTITNKQLVTYARGQLGRPYWYSCFGQRGTRELYAEVAKRYPSQIYKWPKDTYMAQLGQKVHDCSGLVKGACYCNGEPDGVPKYDSKIDLSANGMIDACTTKGDFSTIPEVPGLLVWKSGHVGVFVQTLADGKKLVYEAKGHMYGVCATTETKWQKWGKLPFIKYDSEPAPVFKPYQVKITATELNYRDGPGLKYKINGTIKDKGGIYTIVEEAVDDRGVTWGKLKSGVGWISLKYTKKI